MKPNAFDEWVRHLKDELNARELCANLDELAALMWVGEWNAMVDRAEERKRARGEFAW